MTYHARTPFVETEALLLALEDADEASDETLEALYAYIRGNFTRREASRLMYACDHLKEALYSVVPVA